MTFFSYHVFSYRGSQLACKLFFKRTLMLKLISSYAGIFIFRLRKWVPEYMTHRFQCVFSTLVDTYIGSCLFLIMAVIESDLF